MIIRISDMYFIEDNDKLIGFLIGKLFMDFLNVHCDIVFFI